MKSSKLQQKPTFKPLSIEQQNAIDLLILGKSDKEVAEAVGVNRTTMWEWRTAQPLFMATLERRRAEVWRQPQERLRSLLSKAVENLGQAVESGDLKASIEVLKAVGMYGDGTMNAIGEQDPEKLIRQQAEAQVDREGVPKNTLLAMAEHLDTAAYRTRLAEVEAEIRRVYLDE
jgi:putative insertion element HTH domain-containing protein